MMHSIFGPPPPFPHLYHFSDTAPRSYEDEVSQILARQHLGSPKEPVREWQPTQVTLIPTGEPAKAFPEKKSSLDLSWVFIENYPHERCQDTKCPGCNDSQLIDSGSFFPFITYSETEFDHLTKSEDPPVMQSMGDGFF
jgi:hypothetical protein